MKLSAPPPPPPEPPEPGPDPAPDNPDPNADTADLVAPRTPAADAGGSPQAAASPRPQSWPGWFAGLDAVLVLLTLGLAFLAASFAARNSDLWMHLGTGRLLATGGYTPGTDPLSYTAADRPWVNHSWLWDLGAYLLYSGDGGLLVGVKAVAVAVAFGLLIGIRRPGQPLWPWAGVAAVAVVAAAPRASLNPIVGSMVLYALTLYILFRVPARPGSWRVPLLIGGTFWLWANVDHWFVVGPLTVGLLLAAQWANGPTPAADADADLLPLPDSTTLARALLVGLVACMLNPHHFRVWQIPYELFGNTYGDPRLIPMRYLPLSSLYWTEDGLGYNANGLAYAVLLLAGLYAAFLSGAVGRLFGPPFDVDPLPLPHAVLWFGLAALSGLSLYAVPFLALATVPLVASRLNLFSARVGVGPNPQLPLVGSALGRILTAAAVAGLGVVAWPGWLHPPASNWVGAGGNPANARRVAWAVEPDPELAQAAAWLQERRDAGRLPADTRGLITGLDLANYCAWYAPAEKVFANARYNHHWAELPRFAVVRVGLGLVAKGDDPPDPAEAREARDAAQQVLTDAGVGYVGVGAPPGGSESVTRSKQVGIRMLAETAVWSPWYLDGRTTIAGWRGTAADPRPDADRLRVDPAALAFGPGVGRVPATQAGVIPPPRQPLDAFFVAARPSPPAADEAIGWLAYQELALERERFQQAVRYVAAAGLLMNVPAVEPRPWLAAFRGANEVQGRAVQGRVPAPPLPKDGGVLAAPVLAVRAARRAIADHPAHPDGYFALAQALADTNLPLPNHEREVGRIAALRQCISRLPAPADYRPGSGTTRPSYACQQLAQLYLGPQLGPADYRGIDIDMFGLPGQIAEVVTAAVVVQDGSSWKVVEEKAGTLAADPRKGERVVFERVTARDLQRFGGRRGFAPLPGPVLLPVDLAAEALGLAAEYLAAETGREPTAEAREAMAALDERRKGVDALLRRSVERFLTDVERQPKPRQRYESAKRNGLIRQALIVLKEMEGDLGREFGIDAPDAALQMIALELAVGRLEDAADDIARVKPEFANLAGQEAKYTNGPNLQRTLRYLEFQKLWLEGDYAAAGQALQDLDGKAVEEFKPPRPREGAAGLVWPTGQAEFGVVLGPLLFMPYRAREHQLARNRLAGDLDVVSRFYRRRGLFALLEGDVANARDRFAQTRRSAPPEWELPEHVDPIADEYVRLIDAAAKKGK